MATTMPEQYPTSRPTAANTTWLSRTLTLNWETTLYLIILILAIVTRFAVLEDRVMSHDESLHTYYSWRLATAGDFQHTPLMHGPILFHFTALSYSLFGANDFTSRIYTSALGVLMVMMPFFFRRWLGKWGAILVALMLLASPLLMYYNRYIRHDTPSIVSAMIMAYATLMYLNGPPQLRRKARWLYLLALGMIWNLGSKETAFIYIAIFGLFFTLYWLARLYQHFSRRPSRGLFDTLIISIAIGGVAALFMFAVFSIGLFNYPTLEGRIEYLTGQIPQLFTGGRNQYRLQHLRHLDIVGGGGDACRSHRHSSLCDATRTRATAATRHRRACRPRARLLHRLDRRRRTDANPDARDDRGRRARGRGRAGCGWDDQQCADHRLMALSGGGGGGDDRLA